MSLERIWCRHSHSPPWISDVQAISFNHNHPKQTKTSSLAGGRLNDLLSASVKICFLMNA